MRSLLIIFILLQTINAGAQSSALQLADSLYASGNYTKSINTYQKLDDKANVYAKIAKAYIALGNYDKALENYKTSVTSNPKNALLKYDYAKLLLQTKKYNEASDLFEELIYLDYKNPNYHYQKGLVLEKLKDSTAMNRFLSAYELDKTHQKAIFKIARFHLVKRNHKVSHRYIDKGLESYANNTDLMNLKAQNYFYQQYYNKAALWFEKLIDLGEGSEFIHDKLSTSYAQNDNFNKAIHHSKQVLKYNPKDAKSMYAIGIFYRELGDYAKAEEFIRRYLVVQDVPLHKQYVELGKTLNRQKKYDEALKIFQIALQENPTEDFTKFLILRTKDEYYADREAVVKLYEKFIKQNSNSPLKPMAEMRLSQLKEDIFMKKD